MGSSYLLTACPFFLMFVCASSWIVRPLLPSKYILEIKTDLEQKKFYGKVTISANCEVPKKTVTLYALKSKLVIDESKVLVEMEGENTNLVDIAHWGGNELFLIETKEKLVAGRKYVITVPFEGELGNGAQEGYYIVEDDGRFIAANQFSKLQARSGFPCFDEVFMTAKFQVFLHRRENERSFSSMALEKTVSKEGEPGWMTDEYKMSMKLSPYLIAYAVTNIPFKSNQDSDKRFYYWYKEDSRYSARPGEFAREETEIQSNQLVKFYNLPPLDNSVSKIDVLLHPQFPYAYVGGWGLIFTKETPAIRHTWDIPDKMITYIRLAFQYFGGIVAYESMQSAMFFKSLIVYLAEMLMENRKDYSFVSENYRTIDGAMLSNQFVGEFDPDFYKMKIRYNNANVPWDDNHYKHYIESKGILIIRMIHHSVGPSVFKTTLKAFYEKYKYQYASEKDFWDYLNWSAKPFYEKPFLPITARIERNTVFSRMPLPNFYRSAITQSFSTTAPLSNLPHGVSIQGVTETWKVADSKEDVQFDYPVIKVSKLSAHTLMVKQERFRGNWVEKNEEKDSNEIKKRRWWIPVTYTTRRRPDFKQTSPTWWIGPMHDSEGIKLYEYTSKNDWVIFNIQSVGLCRVMYEDYNWDLLIKALNDKDEFKKIHYLNRVQLVRDALDFGFVGDLSYDTVFRLVNYLQFEDHSVVWTVFLRHVENLESAIRRTDYYQKYQGNMKKLLTVIFNKIFPKKEWTDIFKTPFSNDLERNAAGLKIRILNKSLSSGVDELTYMSRTTFDSWKAEDKIPEYKNGFQRDLIVVTLGSALSTGDKDDFQFVFNKLSASNKNDKYLAIYLKALSNINKEDSMNELLNWVFSESSNEILEKKLYIVRGFVMQPKAYPLALNYVYTNFENIKTNLNGEELNELVRMFALEMNSSELTKLEKFIKENPELSSNEDISTILKQGQIGNERRQTWLSENKESLELGLTAWEFNVKSD